MTKDSHLCAVPVIPIDVRRCMRISGAVSVDLEGSYATCKI